MGNYILNDDTPACGEIVVYQPDEVTRLEVMVGCDTVWLTQAQLASLFQKDQSVVARHIRNVFSEGELEEHSNMQILHNTLSKYKPVKVYSLDVIISVGYRVKSFRGTQFRRWATTVLKEYMLKGYSLNHRLQSIEDRLDRRMGNCERRLDDHQQKIDFFIRTSLPPVEGIFYDGQIFDAYVFVSDLIKSARHSLVVIDNYIDESVLVLLSKREPGVNAEIRTGKLTDQLMLDIQKYNSQCDPINIIHTNNIHDRFLVVDEAVYHIGASLKDLGKKLFAFSKMSFPKEKLL